MEVLPCLLPSTSTCNASPFGALGPPDLYPQFRSARLQLHRAPRTLHTLKQNLQVMSPVAQSTGAMAEAERKAMGESFSPLKLTYLEGNSWLWELTGLQVLVDPVLVGNLDFGIPWLYDAAKRQLKKFNLEDLPFLDLLLITQNFDDHCHMRTLEPLSKMSPDLQVISTPNAKPILSKLFQKAIYLEPGQSKKVQGSNGSEITVRASAGPILGPPWQRPENGYFIEVQNSQITLYYEPHCVYHSSLLEQEKADIIITPVIKQVLPAFTLVSGQEDAVELARLLQAKFVVAMNNGDLESKGLLARMVLQVGSTKEFRDLLHKSLPNTQVLEPVPGVPLEVPFFS
eukprot:c24793_g1_i1 orf=488-1516(-)